jgi:FkbM family methyltransferase
MRHNFLCRAPGVVVLLVFTNSHLLRIQFGLNYEKPSTGVVYKESSMFQPAGTLHRLLHLSSDLEGSATKPPLVSDDPAVSLRHKHAVEFCRVYTPRVIPLGNNELLVRTLRDFYLVVPGWNIDVAPGILRDGYIEAWTNEVFLSLLKEGDSVVNVGANFGYYSVLGAQKVGRSGKVYAVEANSAVYPFLLKSVYWSGFPDVIRAYNFAAASPDMENREVDFLFDPQFIGGGNLFNANPPRVGTLTECLWSSENIHLALDKNRQFHGGGGAYSKVRAVCRTLDSTLPADDRIAAMIIDAEGSECFVIGGARELIQRNPRMSIIVEWGSGVLQDAGRSAAVDAMWHFLLNVRGYSPFRICPEGYAGVGAMPHLEPLSREQLYNMPHSDVLLRPAGHAG